VLFSSSVSTSTTPLHLLSYIDKIGKLYPYGVSVASIVDSQAHAVKDARPVCVLCVVSSGQAAGTDGCGALLEAICSKGLRLSKEEYQVEYFEGAITQEDIETRLRALGARAAIVFGGATSPGVVTQCNGTVVLHTHVLEKIAADQLAKKGFWKQLQESILPTIEGR
jgi:hypothetical protein